MSAPDIANRMRRTMGGGVPNFLIPSFPFSFPDTGKCQYRTSRATRVAESNDGGGYYRFLSSLPHACSESP
eukprot:2903700-Rhodomonas_salina.3